jgi:glycosyltransferase involved in cell wall biosynthesis
MDLQPKPLISFVVVAYKQEDYIEEAVLSALSQTYQPLEIIISDDNSPDNTFGEIERIVSEYTGPHNIVLNRNIANIGLIPHVNKVFEMAKGELIIVNAGDDISRKERTNNVYSAWIKSEKKARTIVSSVQRIDHNSDHVGKPIIRNKSYISELNLDNFIYRYPGLDGASCAYDRRIFDKFGPLRYTSIEDRTLAYRSIMDGNIVYIPTVDVMYREGGITQKNTFEWASRYHGDVFYQLFHDLDVVRDSLDSNRYLQLKKYALSYSIWANHGMLYYLSDKKTADKVRYLWFLIKNPLIPSLSINIRRVFKIMLGKL